VTCWFSTAPNTLKALGYEACEHNQAVALASAQGSQVMRVLPARHDDDRLSLSLKRVGSENSVRSRVHYLGLRARVIPR
jgi:hypothetical protein